MYTKKTEIFNALKVVLEMLGKSKSINDEFGNQIEKCDNWTSLLHLYAEENIRRKLRKSTTIKALPISEFFYLGYFNKIIKNNDLIDAIESAPEDNFRDLLQHTCHDLYIKIEDINHDEYRNLLAVLKHKKPSPNIQVSKPSAKLLSLHFCDEDIKFVKLCNEFSARSTPDKNNEFVYKTQSTRNFLAQKMKQAYLDSDNKNAVYDFVETVNAIDKQILTEPLNTEFGDSLINYDERFIELQNTLFPDYDHAKKKRYDKIEVALYGAIIGSLLLALIAVGLSLLMPATAPIMIPLAIGLGALSLASAFLQFGIDLVPEILVQCTVGLLLAIASCGSGQGLGSVFIKGSIWNIKEPDEHRLFGENGYRKEMITFFKKSKAIYNNSPESTEELSSSNERSDLFNPNFAS